MDRQIAAAMQNSGALEKVPMMSTASTTIRPGCFQPLRCILPSEDLFRYSRGLAAGKLVSPKTRELMWTPVVVPGTSPLYRRVRARMRSPVQTPGVPIMAWVGNDAGRRTPLLSPHGRGKIHQRAIHLLP